MLHRVVLKLLISPKYAILPWSAARDFPADRFCHVYRGRSSMADLCAEVFFLIVGGQQESVHPGHSGGYV